MIVSGKMANGWSELYLVKGGKDLQTEEDIFTVKEDATKGQIRSAFRKFSKGKLENISISCAQRIYLLIIQNLNIQQ